MYGSSWHHAVGFFVSNGKTSRPHTEYVKTTTETKGAKTDNTYNENLYFPLLLSLHIEASLNREAQQ